MVSSLRPVVFGSALLALAALLGSCDGSGGGGSSTKTVYFSMSNYDGCSTAYLTLNLLAADAELTRTEDGSPDCTLSPELAAAGCTISYDEINQGASLLAAVTGCRVPIVSNLFSCKYGTVDIAILNTNAGSECGCYAHHDSCYVNTVCDVCATEDANRGDCERCDNERDDDGDNLADCYDPDCELTEICGFGRTTITCLNSTTTSTVTSTSLTAAASEPDPAPMTELFGTHD